MSGMSEPAALADFAAALDGQYQIERELGRGGMGIVYLARDLKLDRRVAIKTLPAQLAADATVRERFLREARTAASLSHPNIVPIHRADESNGFVYFVMGFVDGESLAQRLREHGPMSPAQLVPILIDLALALGYAHSRGVVHRDVKGENILLDRDGRAMVTDFGIARLAQSTPMTQTGTVLGTVYYMSPEQVAGSEIDGRSDLYSFGVLAFHALTGRFPFESETPSAVLVAHVTKAAPPLRIVAPLVPRELASMVDRLLLKDPDARYADADELADALQAIERALPTLPDAGETRVSSDEAQAIWERAALLQQMTGEVVPPPAARRRQPQRTGAAATAGFDHAQVREVAAEVGIPARYVDQALAERTQEPAATAAVHAGPAMRDKPNAFMGAHTKLEFEATIDGELVEEDFEEIADEIRRGIGDLGNITVIGKSLTWTSWGAMNPASQRKLQISVTSRNGRTQVRGFEDLSQMGGGIMGGIMGGGGGGMGGVALGVTMATTKSALIAFPVAGAFVLAAYGIARVTFGSISRKRERELRTTLERVVERIRETVARQRLAPEPERKRLR